MFAVVPAGAAELGDDGKLGGGDGLKLIARLGGEVDSG
jgi:hypothetical protein